MTTAERLIAAAASLLDTGGESAVTLRAVAAATELSHNAPYKHFDSRDALLAAVAANDFRRLRETFDELRASSPTPGDALAAAIESVIQFSEKHPGRYRLLLSNPAVASQEGALAVAANDTFRAFAKIIEDCQAVGVVPAAPSAVLSGIVFAALNGLIDAQSSGRLQTEAPDEDARAPMRLFLRLLSQRP